MNLDADRFDDAVLALLLLGLRDGQRTWWHAESPPVLALCSAP
jgi:hypothetical protein